MKNRQKAWEYIPFFLMSIMSLLTVVAGGCLTDFSSACQAVNYFLVSVSLVLSTLLYSFCFFGLTWDVKEKRLFEVLVYLFYIFALLAMVQSICEWRDELWRHTMRLYTVSYLSTALYWFVFWLFLKRRAPSRFQEKIYRVICYVYIGIYCLVTLANQFTGFCFFVTPNGDFVVRSYWLYGLTFFGFVLYLFWNCSEDTYFFKRFKLNSSTGCFFSQNFGSFFFWSFCSFIVFIFLYLLIYYHTVFSPISDSKPFA